MAVFVSARRMAAALGLFRPGACLGGRRQLQFDVWVLLCLSKLFAKVEQLPRQRRTERFLRTAIIAAMNALGNAKFAI